MKARHLLVSLLVVALLVLAVRPAPAEADPTIALAIAGAVVAVVVIVVYLVVANVEGGKRADAGPPAAEAPMLVVYVAPAHTTDAP